MATNFKTNNTAVETAYATYADVYASTLFGAGTNQFNVLGDGTGTDRPIDALGNLYGIRIQSTLGPWSSAAGGNFQSLAIRQDGSLWATGWNNAGGLGLGDTSARSSFTKVTSPSTTWTMVASGKDNPGFSIAIASNGTIWSTGSNGDGQLGQGNRLEKSIFTQIGTDATWSKVYIGGAGVFNGSQGHVVAVKTDGTLWSWGNNVNGQLGLGDRTHRSSPVQVGALTTWSSAGTGEAHTLAIKTDGTLWAWGVNQYGQLGLNDITYRSSPVQVGALTSWSVVGAGGNHTLAIKTDGTLWSWGNNENGQLGLGDRTHRSSPVQVGALTNWSKVAGALNHSVAIKTDGTLWSWGNNTAKNISSSGLSASSPVQIGGITGNWIAITAGNGFYANGNYTLAVSAINTP